MASAVEKKNLAKYLKEARSWETDKVMALEKSRRVAWIIASISAALMGVAVYTISTLTPLQRVEAYVVRVNDTTGMADVLRPLGDGSTTYDEAVNRYFAQSYVRFREGYFQPLADDYYYNVGVMSSPAEQSRYLLEFDPKNSHSPLNVYGKDGHSTIAIQNTTFLRPSVAQIRYKKDAVNGSGVRDVSEWTATVYFRFSSAPMSERDRAVNPLGFQVLNYTNIQERSKPVATAMPTVPAAPVSAVAGAMPDKAAPVAVPAIQSAP